MFFEGVRTRNYIICDLTNIRNMKTGVEYYVSVNHSSNSIHCYKYVKRALSCKTLKDMVELY